MMNIENARMVVYLAQMMNIENARMVCVLGTNDEYRKRAHGCVLGTNSILPNHILARSNTPSSFLPRPYFHFPLVSGEKLVFCVSMMMHLVEMNSLE